MNSFMDEILYSLQEPTASSTGSLVLTLLSAFLIGQLNAWFYKWTHRGVSYSRGFTQALVLITMIASMSMMLIATAPLAAFGLLGGLAIIRFRTIVRDARDNVYVLLCLVCGMAMGLGFIQIAAIGALGANLIAWYLHMTGFGGWRSLESVLRFQISVGEYNESDLKAVLARYCKRHTLVSIDEGPAMESGAGNVYQCVYRVRLRDPESAPDLLSTLREAKPIRFVNLLVDPEHEEVA